MCVRARACMRACMHVYAGACGSVGPYSKVEVLLTINNSCP